ncbi:hypothetical protein GCM10009579_47530 [Streptomyces javensis]|uniref:Uncharacterized protein n=1 Tax=Streptomyces javensis TaxID=114698 RepID=A0ABN1X310_9ACTN
MRRVTRSGENQLECGKPVGLVGLAAYATESRGLRDVEEPGGPDRGDPEAGAGPVGGGLQPA